MRNSSKFSTEEYIHPAERISTRSNLVPRGHLLKSGDILGCPKAGTILEEMAIIYTIEATSSLHNLLATNKYTPLQQRVTCSKTLSFQGWEAQLSNTTIQ